MADETKFDDAEKAYAAAAAEVKPVKAEAPAKADAELEAAKPAAKAAPAKAAPKKKKPAAVKRAVAKVRQAPARAKARIARKPIAAKAVANAKLTVSELKEKIMTKNTTTTDFTKPIADAFGEYQNRAKAAYDKGTETLAEATEFAKGNVEALVESSKIFAAGVQDLSKTYVEEAKTAYETVTADVKEFAAVKSPTELFQLQGKIARRNFDALVAAGTKNTDAFVKLATDAFAPITGRVTLAADKLAKVA
jgi:phasin family protein